MVRRHGMGAWLTVLVLCGGVTAKAAEFSARVDRGTAALHEPVVLTLSLTDSETQLRAEGVSPNIDLSVLGKDFDVGTPRVTHRYNVNQGRGRSTSELSVELFPRRAGGYTIPAFHLDSLRTQPIRVTVRDLPADALPEVFSRGGVSKSTVWQREQFIAWLDVYHRITLKSASVGEYINTEPMRIELLEHRELPQGEREEEAEGTRYRVTRIAWAIYPKDSGELRVILPDVWLETADGRKRRLPHRPEKVIVRALPATVGEDIPVGTPRLTQTAPTPAPSVNQLSSWTVTASGPFSRYALPDSLPLPPAPARVKRYADRGARHSEVVADGVTNTVDYTLSALPEQGGHYRLPKVRVPYFDTGRGEMAVAELAETVLDVSGTVATAAPAKLPLASPENLTASVATRDDKDVLRWQWGSALFALLWLTTLALWWRSSRACIPSAGAGTTYKPMSPQGPAMHPLQARLLAALGGRSLDLGLRAWEARYGVDYEIRDAVHGVQTLLYGPHKSADDTALGAQVDRAIAKIRAAPKPATLDVNADPWRPEAFRRGIPPA